MFVGNLQRMKTSLVLGGTRSIFNLFKQRPEVHFFVYAEGERLNPAMLSSLHSLALQLPKDESVRQ